MRELRAASGIPVLVDGAQSVGAIPVDAAGVDFLTISGQKWLCGPDATGALFVADPERLRIASPSYFSQAGYDEDGTFVLAPAQPDSSRTGGRRRPSPACSPALEARPAWAFDRAAEVADRCRDLLAPHFEVIVA